MPDPSASDQSRFTAYASRYLADPDPSSGNAVTPVAHDGDRPTPSSVSHDPFLASPSASKNGPRLHESATSHSTPSRSSTPPFPGPGIDGIPSITDDTSSSAGGLLFDGTLSGGTATDHGTHRAVPDPYGPSSDSEGEIEADLDRVAAMRRSLRGGASAAPGQAGKGKRGWLAYQSVFPSSSSSESSQNSKDSDPEEDDSFGYERAPQGYHVGAVPQLDGDRSALEEPLLGADDVAHLTTRVPVRLQVYRGRFGHWEREGLRKYRGSNETKAATTLDLAAYAATSDSAYSSYRYAPSIPFPPEQDTFDPTPAAPPASSHHDASPPGNICGCVYTVYDLANSPGDNRLLETSVRASLSKTDVRRENTWVFHLRPYAGWLMLLVTAVWVWSWGVIRGVGRVAVAAVVGECESFYDPLEITTAAAHRATGTSLGSICLGSLIVASSMAMPSSMWASLGKPFGPALVGRWGLPVADEAANFWILLLTLSSTATALFTATAGYLYMAHSLHNPTYAPIAAILCGGIPFLAIRTGSAVLTDVLTARSVTITR
ncbi:hypothetical protein A1Q1_08229 [Trichosporon asahii var. asahii CBS 2479]|uniref:Protein PNS1 n=1 Tax=Trichosporon asahii var. asahii (strain ATCC 90039 / CBS 2479 / JCM 2466 / KCTC 7840 / NBRC 103889/ NCYC 2677 / UAMH 7654) TaxID=1186058 RepID=J6F5V3_TRIAS|nr:hypothetical protein A1Q1_08229 [Trichosporon asahii var. asahii CBS 2479]EJT50677.1 hypothetical protein A1Q1_08229 [Trichosporon asahii var. asahii CBS 2479]